MSSRIVNNAVACSILGNRTEDSIGHCVFAQDLALCDILGIDDRLKIEHQNGTVKLVTLSGVISAGIGGEGLLLSKSKSAEHQSTKSGAKLFLKEMIILAKYVMSGAVIFRQIISKAGLSIRNYGRTYPTGGRYV